MVQIVADTTCGLSRDLCKQRGIPLIPQVVIFGDQSYHDDVELDTAAFLEKLKLQNPAKTSAPEPTLYQPIFQVAGKGEPVIWWRLHQNQRHGAFAESRRITRRRHPDRGLAERLVQPRSMVLVAHEMAGRADPPMGSWRE
jgi:hypothetical protein